MQRRSVTSSQTVGPFPHESWRWSFDAASASAPDSQLIVCGTVYDGAGQPIDDAVLEAWTPATAIAEGTRAVPAFRRVPTDTRGQFRFALTASAPRDAGEPALYLALFARGVVKHQFTAVFLEGDASAMNSALLQQVPQARRSTLIARKTAPREYEWDIWLQTDKETVFFDYR